MKMPGDHYSSPSGRKSILGFKIHLSAPKNPLCSWLYPITTRVLVLDLFQKHFLVIHLRPNSMRNWSSSLLTANLQSPKSSLLGCPQEVRTLGSKVKISGLLISPINPTFYKYVVGEITPWILTSIPPHPRTAPVFHPFPVAAVVTDQGQHRIQRTSILTLLLCQLNTWTDLLNGRGKTEM